MTTSETPNDATNDAGGGSGGEADTVAADSSASTTATVASRDAADATDAAPDAPDVTVTPDVAVTDDETREAPQDRRNARRWMLVSIGLIAAVFVALGLLTPDANTPAIPAGTPSSAAGLARGTSKKGEPAPTFDLRAFDGRTVSRAGLAGKPAVVNFWASWCQPCRREMPAFDAAARRLGDRATVVGIAVDDTDAAAQQFARKIGVSYPLAYDTTGRLKAEFGILGLPSTFFLDASGRIVDVAYGELNAAQIDERLNANFGDTAR